MIGSIVFGSRPEDEAGLVAFRVTGMPSKQTLEAEVVLTLVPGWHPRTGDYYPTPGERTWLRTGDLIPVEQIC